MMGKILSLGLGMIILIGLFIMHQESDKTDSPESHFRSLILVFCILTSMLLGFLINLNF
jgi:hypothetical protein